MERDDGNLTIFGGRERSQFGGRRAERIGVLFRRACGPGVAPQKILEVEAPEVGGGATPGAFEGGDLSLHTDEEFGGRSRGKKRGGERFTGRFGENGLVQLGLDLFEAALLPVGADHGIDVEGLGGAKCRKLALVCGNEGVVIGGVFAGEDDGGGIDSVLQGVEAGGGLALGGAGSGRVLGVGAVGGDLGWACHDSDVARARREGRG